MRPLRALLLAAGLAAAFLASCRRPEAPAPSVEIRGHRWQVELATTVEDRYRGLSGRADPGEGRGMLFVYPQPCPLSFCMRGCASSLDIAFLDGSRRVVGLATMAVEPDLAGRQIYSSPLPAQYALEVRGGALARAGVRIGDEARFRSIPPAAKAQPGP